MSDNIINKNESMPDYAPATETHAESGSLKEKREMMSYRMPFIIADEEYNNGLFNSFMKYGLGATPWG